MRPTRHRNVVLLVTVLAVLDRLGAEGVKLLLGEGRLDDSGDFTKGAGLNARGVEAILSFLAVQAGPRDQVLNDLDAVVGGTEAGAEGLKELSRISAALKALGVADAARARAVEVPEHGHEAPGR